MTYRGKMDGGVVVLEGDGPPDGTVVMVVTANDSAPAPGSPGTHHAIGIWKDRTDLPADSLEASKYLRERMMRPIDE